ncbi:C40 family peptidase [Roseivivax sp. CAU 1753]
MTDAPPVDRRLLPANGRVAATSLKGHVTALAYVSGQACRIALPVVDLLTEPGGPRDRQLLFGAEVNVFEDRDGWAFLRAEADGYVGYVASAALAPPVAATHRVRTRATHLYSRADLKSTERQSLSLGALVAVTGTNGAFAETEEGFVPAGHLAPISDRVPDPVAVAERLVGTPYLWGGNSASGIDCSGLVQIGCRFAGIACPGDSDLQEQAFAHWRVSGAPRRGDLLFWKGHVAWVCDPATILHANAHDMAVSYESLDAAIARIAAQGGGPVTSHVRPCRNKQP